MSRKAKRKSADDDAIEFELINREIDLLLKRLHNCCPGCVATGLLFRGAFLHQQVAGNEETIALCHDIATLIEQSDGVGMPVSGTQH